jgi:pimeloyl-ACP methyl ester carboxylesterase
LVAGYGCGMATIHAPGATLYYEEAGTGPLLLMIPGGPADAGVFASLAAALAARYRIVAYDPRGNSRSRF